MQSQLIHFVENIKNLAKICFYKPNHRSIEFYFLVKTFLWPKFSLLKRTSPFSLISSLFRRINKKHV